MTSNRVRAHEAELQHADAAAERQLRASEGRKDRIARIAGDVTKSISTLGSGALGYAGRVKSAEIKGVTDLIRSRESRGDGNDYGWYRSADAILSSVGVLPTSLPGGRVVNLGRSILPAQSFGIIDWIPMAGFDNDPDIIVDDQGVVTGFTTIQLAAQNMYAFIRSHNSGAKVWDASALGLRLVGIADCYGISAHLQKVLGLAGLVDYNNFGVGKEMITALGFSANDVILNKKSYITRLNFINAKLNQLFMPKSLTIFNRRAWLNGMIFKESTSKQAQYLIFKPGVYLNFHQEDESLQAAKFAPATMTAALNILEAMIDLFLQDEDTGIICGDILKAYGADQILQIGNIPVDYLVSATEDANVGDQIRNGFLLGMNLDDSVALRQVNFITETRFTMNAVDGSGAIVSATKFHPLMQGVIASTSAANFALPFTASFKSGVFKLPNEVYNYLSSEYSNSSSIGLLTDRLNLNHEDVTEMTRFVVAAGNGVTTYLSGNNRVDPYSISGVQIGFAGTEALNTLTIYYVKTANVGSVLGTSHTYSGSVFNAANTIDTWLPMINYNLMPRMIGYIGTGSPTYLITNFFENYTAITRVTLGAIHRACAYAEYGLGSVASRATK